MAITYRAAQIEDIEALTSLTMSLYNGFAEFTGDDNSYTHEELFLSNDKDLRNPKMAFFLAFDSKNAIGFSHVFVRHEYVIGTENSPVGYLEGIYVCPDYRGRGIARDLTSMCENWSKENGCAEFASDCLLENKDGLSFHLKMGLKETERLIFFNKKL